MRQYRLPVIRSDREGDQTRDLARAWTRAFDHVAEPELRLRAALSLARTLVGAERAIVFDEERIIAGVPGAREGPVLRRLFERARRVLEDELVTPELYVARLAPDRRERVALRWRDPRPDTVEIARAIVASCAWALEVPAGERVPANLPDGGATLKRLEQLLHDARRMRRSFAVVYVDVDPARDAEPSEAVRDAVARHLRREVRANDHLGHLGGDAYLALVALESSESEAYPAAQRLMRAAASAAPDACASVGVAICPDDGVVPEDLVEKAGAAAMAAASAGGARPYWYREPAGRELDERARIRAALREDPGTVLELCYQPMFDAATGAPCAVAVSAAWREGAGAPAVPPRAYLAGDPDRVAREALERWTVAEAASAHRAWRAGGLDLHVHFAFATLSEAVVDAVSAGFGSDTAMRGVLAEVAGEEGAGSAGLESFARRLRALGARLGAPVWRTATMPFDGSSALLDFVTVDGTHDVRTLAELALASVVAPTVIATGVNDAERGRWLARHGATVLRGEGLAGPMRLQQLVRWASERRGSLGP
ncbi:MAG TPA: hypothetical protein VK669_15195 [Candidatus Limnocylindrales bacterium]|nr:hypothetical protein [Candidatus Limnocylindrales bacterium]